MQRRIPRTGGFAQALSALGTAAAALCLASSLLPAAARAACDVREAASVPLDVVAGTILVKPALNGSPANFVLDTGAQRSVVTQTAVKRLGLARDEWVGTTMRGIGGVLRRPNADPHSFTLGGVPLVRPILSRDTSLTVGMLPRAMVRDQVIDGLLGRDFLSAFDLDLDVPRHRLTLYRVTGCSGRFLPWHESYTAVPVSMVDDKAIILPVRLDGAAMTALLDSGADASLLAAPGMYRLGLTQAQLADDPVAPVTGLGQRVIDMRRHTFRSLRVGGQTIADPVIWIAPIHLAPITDMLLGADWLAARRVWISYATGQVFSAAPIP